MASESRAQIRPGDSIWICCSMCYICYMDIDGDNCCRIFSTSTCCRRLSCSNMCCSRLLAGCLFGLRRWQHVATVQPSSVRLCKYLELPPVGRYLAGLSSWPAHVRHIARVFTHFGPLCERKFNIWPSSSGNNNSNISHNNTREQNANNMCVYCKRRVKNVPERFYN